MQSYYDWNGPTQGLLADTPTRIRENPSLGPISFVLAEKPSHPVKGMTWPLKSPLWTCWGRADRLLTALGDDLGQREG